ncbi:unnamed protein product [Malus baccata var. baccata]
MEAEPSRRRLRAPNLLSDCTNTISSTTTLASANPKLASINDYLLSALDPKPSIVPLPIPSISSRPHLVLSFGSVHGVHGTNRFCAYNSTKADYKVRQEIDFFGEISGVSMSADDESLYIGIWTEPFGKKNRRQVKMRNFIRQKML